MWQQQQRLKEEHQTKDELYVKNIGVQQAASRAAALAAASSFADAGWNPASCSRDRPYTGSLVWYVTWLVEVCTPPGASLTWRPDNLSVALPPNRRHACPPPCSWAGEASFPALESQLEPAPRGAGKAVHDPLLPLVPDVYKAWLWGR
eukprot:3209127-Amphidinium_carterae.1